MKTFGLNLEHHRGVGPGFDLLRLLLASGVVLWHSFPLTRGSPDLIEGTPFWFLISAMVPMFFALSGFLVTASAARTNIPTFLLNRAARIFPALWSVILTTAFLIGPIVTTLSWNEYLRSYEFVRYLMGMTGLVSFSLPGVFAELPMPNVVNGSLWTVPHELLCYALICILMALRVLYRAGFLVAIFLSAFALSILVDLGILGADPNWASAIFQSVHFAQGAKIVPYFLAGAIFYVMRYKIVDSSSLGVICILVVLAIGQFIDPSARKGSFLWLAAALPLTYIVVWLGLRRLSMLKFLRGRDLSYGIYLWHFPIMQLLIAAFGLTVWWQAFAMSILPVGLVAWLSWAYIEKPALLLRKSIRFAARGAR